MTAHTENALRSSSISQVLDLPLAVATPKARCAEGLIPGEDGEVFDLVVAGTAAICTVVADERAVAQE